jgi:hypothetical protein
MLSLAIGGATAMFSIIYATLRLAARIFWTACCSKCQLPIR